MKNLNIANTANTSDNVRRWVVLGVGPAAIRMLREGEPASSVEEFDAVEQLDEPALSEWMNNPDRWARVVEATLDDVLDVAEADPSAIACSPVSSTAVAHEASEAAE